MYNVSLNGVWSSVIIYRKFNHLDPSNKSGGVHRDFSIDQNGSQFV